MRCRSWCRRDVRPPVQRASEGDPVGRLLHRVHDRGRGRQDVEPGDRLLRSLFASSVQQVGQQPVAQEGWPSS